jgi:putative drug exporter of the RND superfamily
MRAVVPHTWPVNADPATRPSPDRPFLYRFGQTCHDRRWRVIAVWLFTLVGLGALVGGIGSGFATEFSLPDVESAKGFEVLDDRFDGNGAGIGGTLVFEAEQGVTDPGVQPAIEQLLAEIDAIPGVRVVSPYSDEGTRQIAREGENAGLIAYADIELPRDTTIEQAQEVKKQIDALIVPIEGVRIEIGGQVFAEFEPPSAELIGLAFAVVILVVAFGSVIAMGLPIGTAIAGIGVGITTITLLSNLVEMPEFTATIAVMIGLGVGIDYALFIVTRYREEMHAGKNELEAIGTAINTAGRAVLFAGVTVVISLLGMLIMGLSFVNGLAIGAATVVFVTMIASVTLLPALLGFVGGRIEVTRWRGIIAAGLIAVALLGAGLSVSALALALPAAVVVLVAGTFVGPLRRELPVRAPKPLERTIAYRWSRVIQRRPWPAVAIGSVGLLVLALPVLSLRLGFSDEGNYPPETTTRQAYDLLAEGFGPGFNGPLILVAEVPPGADRSALAGIDRALASTPGVAFSSPARPNDPVAPTAAVWQVIPDTSPQAAETEALVDRLRSDVLPGATDATGIDVLVTGGVAVSADFSDYLGGRLPWFLAAVLSLSFVLLMIVFRSVLVPLKAVVMNLISIGAAYGVTVAVFQWGWFGTYLGVDAAGPIEPFIPMMLFAIVFGLSMDYEVFLLSRVKEAYDNGATNDRAVADGLAATARVISAAAAIMVVVFGSFLLETDRVVKLMGFGLAIAVLLDATVVRMVLVPATMELLGDRNWWMPRFLDRLLPKIDVEGHSGEVVQQPAAIDEPDAGPPEREPVGAA